MSTDRAKLLHLISELVHETTNLVANTPHLGQDERAKIIELSLAAARLYRRVQGDHSL